MKTIDTYVADYTEALVKNPQGTIYENLAPVIRAVMEAQHIESWRACRMKAGYIASVHAYTPRSVQAREEIKAMDCPPLK